VTTENHSNVRRWFALKKTKLHRRRNPHFRWSFHLQKRCVLAL